MAVRAHEGNIPNKRLIPVVVKLTDWLSVMRFDKVRAYITIFFLKIKTAAFADQLPLSFHSEPFGLSYESWIALAPQV